MADPQEFNFVLDKEQTGKPADTQQAPIIRDQHTQDIRNGLAFNQEEINKLPPEQTTFAPEFALVLKNLQQAFQQKYAEFGIDNIFWPQHILRSPLYDNLATEGIVHIKTQYTGNEEPADVELRKYIEAQALVHEIYHAIAPAKVITSGVAQKEPRTERHGLAYGNVWDPAIEEGLAIKSLIEFHRILDESLLNGAHVRNAIIEQLKSAGAYSEVPPELLLIALTENGQPDISVLKYKDSYQLVTFLCENIPDFEKLAERARLKGETLALARAIDEKFGKGNYIKLMVTHEENAAEVLQQLQQQRSS